MSYSAELIDEILAACKRVGNKSFVARQYNVSEGSIQRWMREKKEEEDIKKYLDTLKKKAEIVQHYDSVANKLDTAKKFSLKEDKLSETIEEYRLELMYQDPKYKTIVSQLKKFRKSLESLYLKNKSPYAIKSLVEVNLALNISTKNISTNYGIDIEEVERIKSEFTVNLTMLKPNV